MIIADRAASFSRYYDLWMRIITWGRDSQVRKAALDHIQPDDRVLDVGCGTGSLAVQAAEKGAKVIAIDTSPHMLALARRKADEHGVQVSFLQAQAQSIEVEGPFDAVTATFTLSEISPDEVEWVVFEMASRLRMGGKMILADESRPTNPLMRLFSGMQRAIAWLVTFAFLEERPTRLHGLRRLCHQFNLEVVREERYLGGSLHLLVAEKKKPPPIEGLILEPMLHTGVRGLFLDALLWAAPLPLAVKSGLYRLGKPKGGSPLFLTSNFYMTFKKVVEGLRGLDCYLLVEDTEGWNVWCAADAGLFTAEKAAALIKVYSLEDMLSHRSIVLPGLGSKIGRRLEALTGWRVVKAPLYARDLPDFIDSGYRLTKAMRRLDYSLPARLRVGVMSALFAPLWALPLLLGGWRYFLGFTLLGVFLSLFLSLFHYILPGKTGVVKGGWIGGLLALGLLGRHLISGGPLDRSLGWQLPLLFFYALLFGWHYQSESPVIFWKRIFS